MKIKGTFNNLLKGKRDWNIVLIPCFGISWEDYKYKKVLMIYFLFLNVEYFVEIEW